jgi:outer membrane protein assembly factor BamB
MNKLQKNKTLSIIALVLLLTLTLFMTNAISVTADTIQPSAVLSVSPNPVGVDQEVFVTFWVSPLTTTDSDIFRAGHTVTITKPDGTTQTMGPYTPYPHGSFWFKFTPTSVGEYELKFLYPGETLRHSGDVYLPAESPITTLVVQEDPVPWWPEVQPPTDYWERPISAEHRNWASISGPWLMTGYNTTYGASDSAGAYNPYTTAPRAPHIMWTKPRGMTGLAGGDSESFAYYSGQTYDAKFEPPIIMGGNLYYNEYHNIHGQMTDEFVCLNLRTGEELWRRPGTIDIGQDWSLALPSGHGVVGFLWDITGSEWRVWDAFTGKLVTSFDNAMSAGNNIIYDDGGQLYAYLYSGMGGWLAKWNATKAMDTAGMFYTFGGADVGTFTRGFYPWGSGHDWSGGIEWNQTIPIRSGPGASVYSSIANGTVYPTVTMLMDDVLIAAMEALPRMWIGYDLETGQELWTRESPDISPAESIYACATGEGLIAIHNFQKMNRVVLDAHTGTQLFETEPNEYPWGAYYSYSPALIANGKLFDGTWDGYLHVHDIETGDKLWDFYSGDAMGETVMDTFPFWQGPLLADGVVFGGMGEETPTQPLTRGGKLFAIDEETGDEIWSIAGWMGLRAIADGYLVAFNAYDNMIYCFGKGPSATTVTAPKVEVMQGQKVVIEGTVTDQSSGNVGTPCISDEDMSAWMEYMYMSRPFPMPHVRGVDVHIDVIDANGNFRNIGTATSDSSGVFSLVWEPDIPGQYTVIANFVGTESYGSSYAQTSMYVEEAPAATPSPDPTPAPMTDTYVLGMGAAAIIVIIVIGFVLILLMRRK